MMKINEGFEQTLESRSPIVYKSVSSDSGPLTSPERNLLITIINIKF